MERIKSESEYKIKKIAAIQDKEAINPEFIQMSKWMSKRYFCNISELKYKYPNVRTFLEEKEPIDLREDEQYAMLNVINYEIELDIIELKECFKLGFKEALIYLNNMGMLKLN